MNTTAQMGSKVNAGDLTPKSGSIWMMAMAKKYKLAGRRNCSNKFLGTKVINVYLDVLILLDAYLKGGVYWGRGRLINTRRPPVCILRNLTVDSTRCILCPMESVRDDLFRLDASS